MFNRVNSVQHPLSLGSTVRKAQISFAFPNHLLTWAQNGVLGERVIQSLNNIMVFQLVFPFNQPSKGMPRRSTTPFLVSWWPTSTPNSTPSPTQKQSFAGLGSGTLLDPNLHSHTSSRDRFPSNSTWEKHKQMEANIFL